MDDNDEKRTAGDADSGADGREAVAPIPEHAPARTSNLHLRSLAIGASAVALLGLAFVAGMAVADHHHGDARHDPAAMHARAGGPAGTARGGPRSGGSFGGGSNGRRPDGPGMGNGARGMRGEGPARGSGARAGMRSGGMGVVTGVTKNSLTFDRIRGGNGSVTVSIDDDTKVVRHGDAGPRDAKPAKLDDIDEGDIVAVMGARDGSKSGDDDADQVTASMIMLLRAADE